MEEGGDDQVPIGQFPEKRKKKDHSYKLNMNNEKWFSILCLNKIKTI